jgi:DNA-binding SARP family transcriptional activator
LLGVFEARYNGAVLGRWPSRKARLLFAYLALETGRMVAKDLLIELLWPEVSPARGANNLSIAVHQVRSALREFLPQGKQGIVVQQGLYGLDDSLWVDVSEFQAQMALARPALQQGDDARVRRHLIAAVKLYRGDVLEDEPYEEWTEEPRRSLSMVHARALAWLAQDAARNEDWLQVLEYAEGLLKRDACDEAAHRWVMTAHSRLGDRTRALQQYEVCCQRLKSELGAGPASETTELYQRIRRG